ncbi:MAG: hypothetical protein M1833_003976 [Piccolia ochrophora]|nr:MAG: hypothetical protein M1833_003976 [Piccolia ochrophora]
MDKQVSLPITIEVETRTLEIRFGRHISALRATVIIQQESLRQSALILRRINGHLTQSATPQDLLQAITTLLAKQEDITRDIDATSAYSKAVKNFAAAVEQQLRADPTWDRVQQASVLHKKEFHERYGFKRGLDSNEITRWEAEGIGRRLDRLQQPVNLAHYKGKAPATPRRLPTPPSSPSSGFEMTGTKRRRNAFDDSTEDDSPLKRRGRRTDYLDLEDEVA